MHHTAGKNDLNVVIHGRPDLAGPLANFYSDRDDPFTITLISGGRCNHAGPGAAKVLDEVRRDVAPIGDAIARGLVDRPGGNGYFYGIEAENLGDGRQPWPVEQLEAIAQTCAALCRLHGWSANRVIGHREWTRRKPDPRGFSMAGFRARVAVLLAPPSPQLPVPQEEEQMFIVWRMEPGKDSVPGYLLMGSGKVMIPPGTDVDELRREGFKELHLSAALVDAIPNAS